MLTLSLKLFSHLRGQVVGQVIVWICCSSPFFGRYTFPTPVFSLEKKVGMIGIVSLDRLPGQYLSYFVLLLHSSHKNTVTTSSGRLRRWNWIIVLVLTTFSHQVLLEVNTLWSKIFSLGLWVGGGNVAGKILCSVNSTSLPLILVFYFV